MDHKNFQPAYLFQNTFYNLFNSLTIAIHSSGNDVWKLYVFLFLHSLLPNVTANEQWQEVYSTISASLDKDNFNVMKSPMEQALGNVLEMVRFSINTK